MDHWLTELIEGAPLLVALAGAFLLGLRHATDPDHLVAVTSLVAADDGDVRGARTLGAWWGIGHAGTLLAVGLPLIALKGDLPGWLERGAETAVGIVILLLAVRVIYRWRHPAHTHKLRTRRQALGIGMLHGLAGTGAVVVLLIAALPGRAEGGGGARRVRADVRRVDGRVHERVRVGAYAPGRDARLPRRADAGDGRVRRAVRALVRRAQLTRPRASGAR